MQCPKCLGKGFIEYEHGLLQVGCDECEGTGEVPEVHSELHEVIKNKEYTLTTEMIQRTCDDSLNRTEPDNQPVGSRNTRKSRKPQKQKAGKKATKRAG